MSNTHLHLVHKPLESTPWADTRVPERLFGVARAVFGITRPVFSVETLDDDQRVYRMLQAALHQLAGERKSASHNGNDKEPRDPESFAYLDARGDDEGQGLDSYWKWGFAAGWNDHKEHAPANTRAANDVLAERHRQITAEGWTPEHDDEHDQGELSRAAACYALHAASQASEHPGISLSLESSALGVWPWDQSWHKPSNTRRNLVKAGALILAEIERLDR